MFHYSTYALFNTISPLITPKGNHNRAHAPEIIEIRENKRENRWEIDLRRERLEHKLDLEEAEVKALFPEEMPGDQFFDRLADFWEAIDQELMALRLPPAVAEYRQQLGCTTAEATHWQLPEYLTDRQRAVLCHFLPFAEDIKRSAADTAHCFSTFLETEVRVEFQTVEESPEQAYDGLPLHEWRVGLNSIVGGDGQAEQPTARIEVRCPNGPAIREFLPGTLRRNLLEQVLIPRFIGAAKNATVHLKTTQPEALVIGDQTGMVGFCEVTV